MTNVSTKQPTTPKRPGRTSEVASLAASIFCSSVCDPGPDESRTADARLKRAALLAHLLWIRVEEAGGSPAIAEYLAK